MVNRVNIDNPRYDMDTYIGRAKHFFLLTNPLNLLATNSRLERAREVVLAYRAGEKVPYVTTMDEIWHEKYLYDSAYHPESGQKMFLLGRMSAQVPANTLITGCMVIFYKSRSQVLFFQWLNQTFNALVNYTNRSGKSPLSKKDLAMAYSMATFGALFTASSLKHFTKNMSSIVQRCVPFFAVAAANLVNLPMMRQNELKEGITLVDHNDKEVGQSRKAAAIGISQVVFSRIAMAVPSMVLTPVLISNLEKKGFLIKNPHLSAPIQASFIGFLLIFATPLGCAFFRQKTSMKVDKLEPKVRDDIRTRHPNLDVVYYNKGL